MKPLTRLRALVSLRYFRQHRAQWILALIGVATGVAAVVAVGLARISVQAAFNASASLLSGAATHSILGEDAAVEESAYTHLRQRLGKIPMAPRLRVRVTGPDGETWTLNGIDVLREAAFERAGAEVTDAGDFPIAKWLAGEPLVVMPDGFAPGSAVVFSLRGRTIEALVAGTLAAGDASGSRILIADIGTVQTWLQEPGRLDAIDLIASGEDLDAIRDELPPGLRIEAADRGAEGLTRAFDLNLTALSLLTALVGTFIVFNTFNFLVLQRRELFSLEHRLGVTLASQRRQVLLEALATGLAGGLLGVVAGIGLGEVTLRVTRRTVSNLYFDVSGAALAIDPRVLVAGLAVGLASCLAAALWPARNLGNRPLPTGASRPAIIVILALVTTLGLLLLLTPTGLAGALLGIFLTAVGYAALGAPLLSRLTEPVVRATALQRAPLLGLSLRRLPRAIDRMLPAATALTLAVATVVGVGTMIDSFRGTVAQWLEQSLSADFYVAVDGRALDDGLRQRIGRLPEVRAVSRFSTVPARIGGVETELAAADLPEGGFAGFEFLAGDAAAARETFATQPIMLLSESLARLTGLEPGHDAVIETGRGQLTGTVAGIIADYRAGTGRITMSWQAVSRQLGEPALRSLGLYLVDGTDPLTIEAQIAPMLADRDDARFSDTAAIRALSLDIFDQTFEITRALQWIAAIVALIGLTGSLMALQLDRREELHLLDALGVSIAERRRTLRIEACLIGAVVCVFAMPLGMLLAWALTSVINLRAFGWQLSPDFSARALSLGPLVALTGAWVAGSIAARLDDTRQAEEG